MQSSLPPYSGSLLQDIRFGHSNLQRKHKTGNLEAELRAEFQVFSPPILPRKKQHLIFNIREKSRNSQEYLKLHSIFKPPLETFFSSTFRNCPTVSTDLNKRPSDKGIMFNTRIFKTCSVEKFILRLCHVLPNLLYC